MEEFRKIASVTPLGKYTLDIGTVPSRPGETPHVALELRNAYGERNHGIGDPTPRIKELLEPLTEKHMLSVQSGWEQKSGLMSKLIREDSGVLTIVLPQFVKAAEATAAVRALLADIGKIGDEHCSGRHPVREAERNHVEPIYYGYHEVEKEVRERGALSPAEYPAQIGLLLHQLGREDVIKKAEKTVEKVYRDQGRQAGSGWVDSLETGTGHTPLR